jgi:predicted Zn-dependent protease
LDVRLINGATGGWQDAVTGAANRWSDKSTVLDIAVEGGAAGCGQVNGAMKVCNGSFSGSWAGLTTVGLVGKHIQWATVKLDNSAGTAQRAVSCHEIGHALGLGHRQPSETSSCMTPSVSASQRGPDAHDRKMLKRIYKHKDGASATDGGDVRVVRIYTYLAR